MNNTQEHGKTALAIIPARCGSKGIPSKNIKPFVGEPLMTHSIRHALESGCFSRVVVSTDSAEYAEIARAHGAEVPFLRPAYLSGDNVATSEVSLHAIEYFRSRGEAFDFFAVLSPTSPLRIPEDVSTSFALMREKHSDAVVSVAETLPSPLWSNTLGDSQTLKNFISPSVRGLSRQSLPKYYHIHGGIFLTKTKEYFECKDIYEMNCSAYIMPPERSIDIDSQMDFLLAEQLYRMHVMSR